MRYFTLTILLFNYLWGQITPPQLISYQGVARDAAGNILSGQTIGIQLIIHQYTPTGNPVFSEQHSTITNALGIFTLQIGSVGTSSFSSIPWNDGPFYLEVQMDPNGGTSYTSIGTQQILSVPYALYSAKSKVTESVSNTGTSTAWSTIGNYQTDSTINFIGTNDNSPLIFKTANNERMKITPSGKIRVGNSILPARTLISVYGNFNDTVLAHFSNTNNAASLIDIYNIGGAAGTVLRSGNMTNQDTGFIAIKQNDGLNIFSTKDINIYNKDSLKIFADDNISLGTIHNVNIFSKYDSINLYGRTKVNFSTVTNTPLDNAMTINFANSQSLAAAGLRINHSNNSGNSSFGIYIKNVGSNTSGPNVGLGVYSYFNSNAQKKGIESVTSGSGLNIALFLHSDSGTVYTDGYKDWAIYSNKGNVMIKDGHIKSVATYPAPSISFITGTGLTASLNSTSTDVKGIINYTINPLSTGDVHVYFGTIYSQKPVVVITNTGDAQVTLSSVSSNKFVVSIKNTAPTSALNGEIHYIVIE